MPGLLVCWRTTRRTYFWRYHSVLHLRSDFCLSTESWIYVRRYNIESSSSPRYNEQSQYDRLIQDEVWQQQKQPSWTKYLLIFCLWRVASWIWFYHGLSGKPREDCKLMSRTFLPLWDITLVSIWASRTFCGQLIYLRQLLRQSTDMDWIFRECHHATDLYPSVLSGGQKRTGPGLHWSRSPRWTTLKDTVDRIKV